WFSHTSARESLTLGMTVDIFERLGDIPPYNDDIQQVGKPEAVVALVEAVRAADMGAPHLRRDDATGSHHAERMYPPPQPDCPGGGSAADLHSLDIGRTWDAPDRGARWGHQGRGISRGDRGPGQALFRRRERR